MTTDNILITQSTASVLSTTSSAPVRATASFAQVLSTSGAPVKVNFTGVFINVLGHLLGVKSRVSSMWVNVLVTLHPNFEWIDMLKYEVFPDDQDYGTDCIIGFQTDVVRTDTGMDQRVARWDQAIREYTIHYQNRTREQLDDIRIFFHAMRGRLYSFLYRDWTDYTSNFATRVEARGFDPVTALDQIIGVGDGVTLNFQLQKTYTTKNGNASHVRKITKPEEGTVVVAVDGVPTSLFTVDRLTGIVTFTPAVQLTASITLSNISGLSCRLNAAPGTFPSTLAGKKISVSGMSSPGNNVPMPPGADVFSVAGDGSYITVFYPLGHVIVAEGPIANVVITQNPAPPSGKIVTAGYKFYVPVRFDVDTIAQNFVDFGVGETAGIKLVEVRYPEVGE